MFRRATIATALMMAAVAALAITSLAQSNERVDRQIQFNSNRAVDTDGADVRFRSIPARSVPLPSATWCLKTTRLGEFLASVRCRPARRRNDLIASRVAS